MKPTNIIYVAISCVLISLLLFYISTPNTPATEHHLNFTKESGHYPKEFKLEIKSHNKNSKIIYTLDGSIPQQGNKSTFEYTSPIKITQQMVDSNDMSFIPTTLIPDTPTFSTWQPPRKPSVKGIVVRAKLISNGNIKPGIVTKTYFIDNVKPTIPEIYLTIPKPALFDEDTGIYILGKHPNKENKHSWNCFQKGRKWERLAHIQYLSANNKTLLNQDVGIRVHGMASPGSQMKTLKLFARKKYGKKKFKFKPFESQPEITSYKRLLLRTPYSTWDKRFFCDQLTQKTIEGLDIICAKSIPVNLYINGEYWGIHDMAEQLDQHYFKSHFNIPKKKLDYAASTHKTVMGENDFKEVYDFAKNNDLSINTNYKYISSLIDINNFIDYNIIETYFNNVDWPGNNDEKWRADGVSEKWKWLIVDMDAAFKKAKFKSIKNLLSSKEGDQHYHPKNTVIQRALFKNEEFKTKFIKRYEYLMATHLCPKRLLKIIADYEELYRPEIERQMNRWSLPESIEIYKKKNNWMKHFVKNRPQFIIEDIKEQFGVTIQPKCE